MDINKDSIGHKLREIRVLNGLTVSQMADKLGISYDHWRLVDQGKRLPSLDILILVCQKFGVSLNSLFSMQEQENDPPKVPQKLEAIHNMTVDELLVSTNILEFITTNISNSKEQINPQIMGKRLYDSRNKANLSLREAAKQIGIHWTYLQMLEKGKNIPSLKVLQKITEAFNTTPEYLFAYDLPDGKEILCNEFLDWYQSMNDEQKQIAMKFIKGCLK